MDKKIIKNTTNAYIICKGGVFILQSFIFDYYGYNVDKLDNNTFIFKGYTFLLIKIDDSEEEVNKLNNLINSLSYNFNNDVVYIVKNKYDQYVSSFNDGQICILAYKNTNINISDYVKMHSTYLNSFSYSVNIHDIIALWDQRLEYIENQCLVNLNFEFDSHYSLYEYAMYSIGLAINALQYMSDMNVDFNKNNYNATLTHRRIKKMDKYEAFNPFNLIVDHSSRDIAELYKNDLIDLQTLINLCLKYNYSIDEYEYLLARLLYPTFIFDVIEDISISSSFEDNSSIIYHSIAKQNKLFDKIKLYYSYLIKNFSIRPINWLNTF